MSREGLAGSSMAIAARPPRPPRPRPREGRRAPRPAPVPAWLDDRSLTVSLAEVRLSLAFAAGLAEAELNPMNRRNRG